jgi:hypothetical protein
VFAGTFGALAIMTLISVALGQVGMLRCVMFVLHNTRLRLRGRRGGNRAHSRIPGACQQQHALR